MPARQKSATEEGGDMSKPMQERKAPEGNHKEHEMTDSVKTGQHQGHRMNSEPAKQGKSQGSQYQQHEMKRMKEEAGRRIIDPVCGMEAEPNDELSYTYKGTQYYFCSAEDLEKFKKDPEKYVTPSRR